MTKLDSKLPRVGTTIFTHMSALAAEYSAINLSQGYPDFSPPQGLVDALGARAQQGFNQYAPMAGLARLREAIADQILAYRSQQVDPDTEITIVPGATEGIFCAVQAVVNTGDEVIVLDPAYDSYDPAITLAGGRAIHVPLQSDFAVDWERVEAAISPRTRMIMTNSPHNPCGAVFNSDDLEALALLADKYDLFVSSDEVYEHLVYGVEHASVLSHAGLRQRSFAHFSFGKTYSVTGWKTGYCVAPPRLTQELRKVHQFVAFVAVTPIQHALADFMQQQPDYPRQLAMEYVARRDLFLEQLADSKFRWAPAAGTYFQLLDYSALSNQTDSIVAENWTREIGVASIPISVFYEQPPQQHLLRFCFAKSDDVLKEAARRLCAI